MDINVFAKFYEIPSLLFQNTENQNVADRQTDRRTWKQYTLTNKIAIIILKLEDYSFTEDYCKPFLFSCVLYFAILWSKTSSRKFKFAMQDAFLLNLCMQIFRMNFEFASCQISEY